MKRFIVALLLIMIMPCFAQAQTNDWFWFLRSQQKPTPVVRGEYIPHPQIEKDGYQDKFYIMAFKSKSCKFCKNLPAEIEQWRADGYKVYLFDAQQNIFTLRKLKVNTLPTVIMVKDGKEQSRFSGAKSSSTYSDRIKELNSVEPDEPFDYNF